MFGVRTEPRLYIHLQELPCATRVFLVLFLFCHVEFISDPYSPLSGVPGRCLVVTQKWVFSFQFSRLVLRHGTFDWYHETAFRLQILSDVTTGDALIRYLRCATSPHLLKSFTIDICRSKSTLDHCVIYEKWKGSIYFLLSFIVSTRLNNRIKYLEYCVWVKYT